MTTQPGSASPSARERRATVFEAAVVLAAAVLISYQLFVPPLVGMADSGDFERVIPQAGLAHVSDARADKFFAYFNSRYRVTARSIPADPYLTTTSILIEIARLLSKVVGSATEFDIRFLAGVHLTVLLAGFWLVLRAIRPAPLVCRVVVAAAILVVFTDVGYVAYFNSFFSEGTAFAFLVVALGAAMMMTIGGRRSVWPLVTYFIAVGMVVMSKPMYVPLLVWFGPWGIHLSRHPGAGWHRRLAIVCAVLLAGATAWYYRQTPPRLMVETTYIAVFMDLVPASPTPEADLVALGLNPKYVGFSGTHAYQPDSPLTIPEIRAEMTRKLSGAALVRFYAARPVRLYELLARGMPFAFSTRVRRLGYWEHSSGRAPISQAFGAWSAMRERIVPRSVFSLVALAFTAVAAAAGMWRARTPRRRAVLMLYLVMACTAGLEFLIAIVPAGTPDLEKHLFMFNLAFDICLVVLAASAFARARQGRQ